MNESKIKEFGNIIEKDYPNTCGIVVMKDNKLIYENYYNKCAKNKVLLTNTYFKSQLAKSYF